MGGAGVTENVKGDPLKFELWFNGREEICTIQAPSLDVRREWLKHIKQALSSQPKSDFLPPAAPHPIPENKSSRFKRHYSVRKPRKRIDSEMKSAFKRSASLGKGKNKIDLEKDRLDVRWQTIDETTTTSYYSS